MIGSSNSSEILTGEVKLEGLVDLRVSPLWIIRHNNKDRMFQLLLVSVHGLYEVLLLQVGRSIQSLILKVVSSPYVDAHKLAGGL